MPAQHGTLLSHGCSFCIYYSVSLSQKGNCLHVGGNGDGRPKKIKKIFTVKDENWVCAATEMENKAVSTSREISRGGLSNGSWNKNLGSISRGSRLVAASTSGKAVSLRNKSPAEMVESVSVMQACICDLEDEDSHLCCLSCSTVLKHCWLLWLTWAVLSLLCACLGALSWWALRSWVLTYPYKGLVKRLNRAISASAPLFPSYETKLWCWVGIH